MTVVIDIGSLFGYYSIDKWHTFILAFTDDETKVIGKKPNFVHVCIEISVSK